MTRDGLRSGVAGERSHAAGAKAEKICKQYSRHVRRMRAGRYSVDAYIYIGLHVINTTVQREIGSR
jgi:hypothetical protein